MKLFFASLLFHRGNSIQKSVKLRGSKKLKIGGWGDLPYKGGFLKKGGLNLDAMNLQENHEMEEFFIFILFYISFFNFV